jgi:pimeloyl-ACP methyl ester carboxylesterase
MESIAMPNRNFATFVLVHGAWHGGWSYARVAALLRSQGHTVFTPTLTGLGERAHLLTGSINLSTHIDDILGVFRFERVTDVVLVGHSYGGMVVASVADRIPERLRALAYLDAFIPEDGQAIVDIIPEYTQQYLAGAGSRDGLTVPPPPAAFFAVNAADAATVDALTTPHPLGSLTEKVRLTGAYRSVKRHLYVHGAELRRDNPFRRVYGRAKADGWNTHTLTCGHEVMLDMPEKTAELLERMA